MRHQRLHSNLLASHLGLPMKVAATVERSRKKYSMGALYFTLDQLVRKELIVKREGDPTPKRGGKRKIFYDITPGGEKALRYSLEMHDSLWDGISKLAFKKQ